LAEDQEALLCAGDACVEDVSLQHNVVGGHHRHDDDRELRALRLVDGAGVGQDKALKLLFLILDISAVKRNHQRVVLGVDIGDVADVAIE